MMACVICGKKQRIIPVHTVKYSTQNTLPEVLSVAIGNKITSENWNESDKHICYRCNRQCEEYDKLNTRLQDLKEHLLQEYTKRLYKSDGASDVRFKPIRLRAQDCEDGGMVSDDGASEIIATDKDKSKDGGEDDGGENEGEKETAEKGTKNNSYNDNDEVIGGVISDDGASTEIATDKDKSKDGGEDDGGENKGEKETAEKGTKNNSDNDNDEVIGGVISDDGASTEIATDKDKSKDGGEDDGGENKGEKETAEKGTKNNSDNDNDETKEDGSSANPADVEIKTEVLDEEATLEDPEWQSQNLPESVSDDDAVITKKQVTRLTEKTNLRRLPDFEYRQWYSLDGYSYVLHTQNTRGQLLRCHKRGCGVTARVTLGTLVRISGEHTHEPDVRIVERNKLYAKLKHRCMTDPTTPLKTIYYQESVRFPGGAACLPFPEVRMREWRATNDSTIVLHTDASTLEDTGKRFQCEVCNMGFNSSRLLIRHAEKHNKSKTVGRKKMSGDTAFIASSPMTAEKKRLKKKLDKTLSRVIGRLKADELNESGNDTGNEDTDEKRCHKCEKQFTTLKQLKCHIVKEHREVLMCVHCDIAFDTLLLLRRHRTSCRKCCNERLLQRDADNTRELETQRDDEMLRELGWITGQDVTDYVSQDEDDPNWEATNAEESTADEGDDEIKIRKRKSNENVNRLHPCQVCQKTFPNLQQLNAHLYTHSSKKKYECSTCGENFNKKAVLTRHMISQNHGGRIKINPPSVDRRVWSDMRGLRCEWDGTRYQCAVCATSFPRKLLLLHHMKDEEHITDQIIVHEAQPQTVTDIPRKKFKKAPDDVTILSQEESQVCPKTEIQDGPIALGGLRFNSKTEAIRAWYDYSGKRPYECAVCGTGFMSKIRLLAHMEDTDHLADSIVENIPVLEDMIVHVAGAANQIVPSEFMHEVPIEIKEETGRVEILSQVIIAPQEGRAKDFPLTKMEEDTDQTYFIQTENVNGETVMVIQGDLGGSLHENMQLFMDEDGNIVTQDEDGNTVQVMQLDLSAMQEMQDGGRAAEEESSEDDGEYAQLYDDNPGAGLYVDGSGQAEESTRDYYEENESLMDRNQDNKDTSNREGSHDNVEEIQDNQAQTYNNEEQTRDYEDETENNVEIIENVIKSEQDSVQEVTRDTISEINDDIKGNQDIMEWSQDNTELSSSVGENNNNTEETTISGIRDAMKENQDNMQGSHDNTERTEHHVRESNENTEETTVSGINDNMKGNWDNMQGSHDNTERTEHHVRESNENTEETTVSGINDNMKGNWDNMQGSHDNTERTKHSVEDSNENTEETTISGIHDGMKGNQDSMEETQDNTKKTELCVEDSNENTEETTISGIHNGMKGNQDSMEKSQDNTERTEHSVEDSNENSEETTTSTINDDMKGNQGRMEEIQDNTKKAEHCVEESNENSEETTISGIHDEVNQDNMEKSQDSTESAEHRVEKSNENSEETTISGINIDVNGSQDNMEKNQNNTDRIEDIVGERNENTEETTISGINKEIQEKIEESHTNTEDIQNTTEETNIEDIKNKNASEENVNKDKTKEKIEKSEEKQKGKQNRTEQKHTPRMKTRYLGKIEKAEAVSSITSRLRRSKNQK